jgi:hypothetical protein
MGIRANDLRLWWTGLAVSALAAAGILWAHTRPTVSVPRSGEWAHVASVCPSYEVEDWALELALAALDDRDLPVRLALGPCPGRSAIHLEINPAAIDRIYPPTPGIEGKHGRGAFTRQLVGQTIVDCHAYVESPADAEAMAHEVLHCLGYDHPVNAQAGHVLNPDYDQVSLRDFRGIGEGR